MTVGAFVACVVLQIRFDLLTFHLHAFGIEYGHAAASHFRDIAFFEEDKATGNRQQSQLIGGNKVFPIPRPITIGLPERAASSVDGSRESMITVP